jgi:CheY-like chemotaxis protein
MASSKPVNSVVLIVEDETILRMNMAEIIEEAGFDAIEASNADEAVAILESRKDIRIVFTDINMPGSMDGLKLAQAVRNRWPPIELILTSGKRELGERDIPARGRFLAKPYNPDDVVAAVRGFIAH